MGRDLGCKISREPWARNKPLQGQSGYKQGCKTQEQTQEAKPGCKWGCKTPHRTGTKALPD